MRSITTFTRRLMLSGVAMLALLAAAVPAGAQNITFTHGADFGWCNEYARGTFVTAWGTFAGVPTPVSSQTEPPPTTLGGVTVNFTVGATTIAARITYVSASQINFIVPDTTVIGTTYTVSINDGSTTQTGRMKIIDCSLRLFGDVATNRFMGYYQTTSNGQPVITPLYGAGGTPNQPPASTNGVFLVLYGTGHGEGRASRMLIGGATLTPTYVGVSGFTGVTQLNFQLPDNYTATSLLTARFLLDTRPTPQAPGEPAESN